MEQPERTKELPLEELGRQIDEKRKQIEATREELLKRLDNPGTGAKFKMKEELLKDIREVALMQEEFDRRKEN